MTGGFRHVAILGGGGLMGHGIALACLQGSDARVTILSRREETVARGLELVEHGPYGLKRGVERGRIAAGDARAMGERLSGTTDYARGLDGADLVFETIPENVALKHEALAAAESHADDDAVFASNTSSIMIAELAAPLATPGRMVGTHWFYPANVMPLVEVGRSELSDPARLDRVVDWLRAIGKKPVVVGDSPGFFMTRFVDNYIAEAIRMVQEGIAGPAEIDEMCRTGLGWPMGVFELLDDAAAFDSYYQSQQYLHETLGDGYAVPALARKVFLAGYRGNPELKPGSRGGWYDFLKAGRTPAGKKPAR